jgi:hypothetical protein
MLIFLLVTGNYQHPTSPLSRRYPNLAAIANKKPNMLFPIRITEVDAFSIGASWV